MQFRKIWFFVSTFMSVHKTHCVCLLCRDTVIHWAHHTVFAWASEHNHKPCFGSDLVYSCIWIRIWEFLYMALIRFLMQMMRKKVYTGYFESMVFCQHIYVWPQNSLCVLCVKWCSVHILRVVQGRTPSLAEGDLGSSPSSDMIWEITECNLQCLLELASTTTSQFFVQICFSRLYD